MRKIPLLLIPLLIVSFIGCDNLEGPQGDQGDAGVYPIQVDACLLSDDDNSPGYALASVRISNTYSIPFVYINDSLLSFSEFWGTDLGYYQEDFPVAAGEPVNLTIDYTDYNGDDRTAWAEIVMPGNFEITSPDSNNVVIPIDSDIEITWTESVGAEEYYVSIHIICNYYHESVMHYYGYNNSLTIDTNDTLLVYDSGVIFPDPAVVDSLESAFGEVFISARYAYSEYSPESNMQGDALGQFSARNSTIIDFIVSL